MMLHEQVERILGSSDNVNRNRSQYLRHKLFLEQAQEKGLVRKQEFILPIHQTSLREFCKQQSINKAAEIMPILANNTIG